MEKIICDTNSIIYLAKIDLLEMFCTSFEVIIPVRVYEECVSANHHYKSETVTIKKLVASKTITVHSINSENPLISFSGPGEEAVIMLQNTISGSTILTDDKKAVKQLKSNEQTFISSPLVPVLLYKKGMLTEKEARECIKNLNSIGYFSEKVITYAIEQLKKSNLT